MVAAPVIAVGVVGIDPKRAERESTRAEAVRSARERVAAEKQEKLSLLRDEVATGRLVVRRMTAAERARWEKRRKDAVARSTPTELAAKEAVLENRRRRAERQRPVD
jgi:hypothetical protein